MAINGGLPEGVALGVQSARIVEGPLIAIRAVVLPVGIGRGGQAVAASALLFFTSLFVLYAGAMLKSYLERQRVTA